MYTPTDSLSEKEALNSIRIIASSISKQLTDLRIPKPQYPIPPDFDSLIPDLYISVPPDIYARLSTLEISHDLLRALQQRLDVFTDDLQQQYRSAYRNSCLEVFHGTKNMDHVTSLHGVYQALVERQFLTTIRSQVTYIVDEVAKRQSPPTDSRRQFNSDFTPVLEKYFELNGYPSVAHRSILAQKSGMITRQVEVWFQNHRNRAKKDGKRVQRLDSDFPLRQALDLLQQKSVLHQNRLPTPFEESATIVVKNKAEKTGLKEQAQPRKPASRLPTILDDSYHASRPPHAYPMTKKSQFPDPFPCDNGVYRFPPPDWSRKPATTPTLSTAVDMDEFSQLFHLKLNFMENSRHRSAVPLKSNSSVPWFYATTTIPSAAPHASFIRTSDMSGSVLPHSRPLSGTPVSRPIFGTGSLPVIHHSPLGDRSQRKTRSLPRRRPISTSQSNLFSSRSSSFSSVASSGSRVSSSASNPSSPELATPPPLPNLDLPVFADGGQEHNLFDFSHIELSTGYPLSSLLPFPQDFNLTSLNPASVKFTDPPLFDTIFPDFGHNLGEIIF